MSYDILPNRIQGRIPPGPWISINPEWQTNGSTAQSLPWRMLRETRQPRDVTGCVQRWRTLHPGGQDIRLGLTDNSGSCPGKTISCGLQRCGCRMLAMFAASCTLTSSLLVHAVFCSMLGGISIVTCNNTISSRDPKGCAQLQGSSSIPFSPLF